jgi:hypothetical protein
MSFIQRFLMAILPRAWAEDMRADSMRWKLRCSCGHERSFWEIGGIRWKAVGNQKNLLRCPHCGRVTWHSTSYRKDAV